MKKKYKDAGPVQISLMIAAIVLAVMFFGLSIAGVVYQVAPLIPVPGSLSEAVSNLGNTGGSNGSGDVVVRGNSSSNDEEEDENSGNSENAVNTEEADSEKPEETTLSTEKNLAEHDENAASTLNMLSIASLIEKYSQIDKTAEESQPEAQTEIVDTEGYNLVGPYGSVANSPSVTNNGEDNMIVFFKVTSPVEEIALIGDDGSMGDVELLDIFWFKQEDDADDLFENHWDENWIELTALDNEIVTCEGVNDEGQGYTYIFGYYVRLESGETTTSLFDKVQSKQYASSTVSADEVETVKVEPCAVQVSDIYAYGVEIDTTGELTEEILTDIYTIFFLQLDTENQE